MLNKQDIDCVLNVQHNCHDGGCTLGATKKRVERIETDITVPCLAHTNHNSFIINISSFYSAESHRLVTKDQQLAITPQQWSVSVDEGLTQWIADKPPRLKKDKKKKKNVTKGSSRKLFHPSDSLSHSGHIDPLLL